MATTSAARAAVHRAGNILPRSELAVDALDSIQCAVLAADQASSVTTGTTITGFTAELEANKSYIIECFFTVSSAATTTGIKFEPVFSGTGTRAYAVIGAGVAAATFYSERNTTGLIGPTDLPAASGIVATTLQGSVITTTAGTLSIQFASEVNASAATVKAGSFMRVTEV